MHVWALGAGGLPVASARVQPMLLLTSGGHVRMWVALDAIARSMCALIIVVTETTDEEARHAIAQRVFGVSMLGPHSRKPQT